MNAIGQAAGDDPFNAVRHMGKGQKAILRNYITGNDHLEYKQLSDGWCQLNVTHSNLRVQILQQRLSLHSTIGEIKHKLHHHCGTGPHYMELHLKASSVGLNTTVAVMNDDSKKLGFYSPQNGMTIHIVDQDPNSLAKTGWLENVNLVKKYEISEEDYDKREKTVRSYKREQLAKDPNWKPKCRMDVPGGVPGKENAPAPGPETVEGIEVGNRCEVQPGARRGTVKYVGESKGNGLGAGHWIGVQFDEPLGRNNGMILGTKYFECPDKHGAFARGKNVTVGDFPEVDPFADLSDSDDEL